MARNDITPWQDRVLKALPTGAAGAGTFSAGEPLVLASGALTPCGSDPAVVDGVAATPSTRGFPSGQLPTGTLVPVYDIERSNTFRSRNFATDGAGTAATPTQANAIGQMAGLIINGSNFVVDTGASNLILHIEDVQDAAGTSITHPTIETGAGVMVVFRFV